LVETEAPPAAAPLYVAPAGATDPQKLIWTFLSTWFAILLIVELLDAVALWQELQV
jgi:hypothetical protein